MFIKGQSGFAGRKHSRETRDAISENNVKYWLSKSVPEEMREKISNTLKGRFAGENHPNWQGGITIERTKIRMSPEMKVWRKEVFERDNYTCVKCNKRGGYLIADHIKAFSKYPKLRTDVGNGRTLCKDCNYESTYVLKEWASPLGHD